MLNLRFAIFILQFAILLITLPLRKGELEGVFWWALWLPLSDGQSNSAQEHVVQLICRANQRPGFLDHPRDRFGVKSPKVADAFDRERTAGGGGPPPPLCNLSPVPEMGRIGGVQI